MSNIKSVQLLKSSSFSDLEALAKTITLKKPEKIQIPNSLSFSGGFGVEGAALQVFATWLRTSNYHIVHTSVTDDNDPEKFESLCNSLFGLCSLRLADVIWSNKKQEVELSIALKPAIPKFKKIRSEEFKNAFKGMYLALPAIKSKTMRGGRDREFDSPLYNGNEVIGAQKFLKITKESLSSILPQSIPIDSIDNKFLENLSEILRELFTNTHRHARVDFLGNPYDKNFRGIIFNMLNLTSSRMDELTKTPSKDRILFFGDWKPPANEMFRALDITVVDSGPGYARRWHSLDNSTLTVTQEKEAIIECFTKHRSSDRNDSSGSGLSNVLRDLRELKGWLRLRTGRTLVEKSFFNHQGNNNIDMDNIKEMDTFVEGVVFNVVIPLKSLMRK